MSIIITIKPETQEELTRQATAHGVQLESYAASLLEEAAHVSPSSKALTEDQLDRALQDLSRLSSKIPLLPDEAFSREGLYQDHD